MLSTGTQQRRCWRAALSKRSEKHAAEQKRNSQPTAGGYSVGRAPSPSYSSSVAARPSDVRKRSALPSNLLRFGCALKICKPALAQGISERRVFNSGRKLFAAFGPAQKVLAQAV